jgi:Raf kinase inhibitor-like YbhB/YbcL family protein
MKLTSAVFTHGGEIPTRFTCEGQDISPPLEWNDVPSNAKSLALIVDDPDAPDPAAPRMTWVHWVLYNMPPTAGSMGEGARELPPGTKEGVNDWKRAGYGGPCPPLGRHRYFHKLYALDTVLPDMGPASKSTIEEAMKPHIIERVELIGTYQKRK